MSKLIVKPVDFFGDSLIVVKDQTGKIYTGVSHICKGIGFSKSQKDTQVQNIQNDVVLNKGCLKFQAGVIDPHNDALAIELDFLPLWLAKISITPKMQEEQPGVTKKLVNYQLKAKDVLASAFLSKPTCIEDLIIMQAQSLKDMREQVNQANYHALEAKAEAEKSREEIQAMRDVVATNSNNWREDCRKLIVRIAQGLGGNGYIGDVQREIYELMRTRLKCKLDVQLTNMRRRMADEGVCKSKRDKLTKLDVIAKDNRLIEGYVAIVKELACRYES
ncbi:MAG: phage antirepressor N-terminal domain-containing protein [Clostridium sp.]|uniref:phage antirepressor N-terminal domain-containing protein n=2 Tax=Clostridium TaxID=1485 RepID=UPI00290F789D|nr:phage antirepressor N-terminal domain-containing protein [Clostridium sp.]